METDLAIEIALSKDQHAIVGHPVGHPVSYQSGDVPGDPCTLRGWDRSG